MSKYKSPHAKLNFKKAALYGEQQGFGPFRQRFAPVPKNIKTPRQCCKRWRGQKDPARHLINTRSIPIVRDGERKCKYEISN